MRGFRGGVGHISMALAIAGAALGLLQPLPAPQPRIFRKGREAGQPTGYGGGRSKTTFHFPHGDRERARRRRQIERGQLRVENGLDPLTV